MNHTIGKIFEIYQTLFNIKFVRVNDCECWQSDVIKYSIINATSDVVLGHLYFDIFSRPGKNKQTRCFSLQPTCIYPFENQKYNIPIIALVSSFEKQNPSLLHFHEVISLFHEMGHVMHHIFGKTRYIIFSGTNVELDFIETPAQILDLLCWEKDVIKKLSSHCKTKKELPEIMINKIIKLKNLDIGLTYKRNILLSLFDQLIYSSDTFVNSCEDILKMDNIAQIKKLLSGLYEKLHNEIMMDNNGNNRITLNEHAILPQEWINFIYGSDSQYYCSIWGRVLSSDLFNEKIKGRQLNKYIGDDLKSCILNHGGTKNAYDMICTYINRKPAIDGFIAMHELDTNMEYSFFLNTDQIKNTQDNAATLSEKLSFKKFKKNNNSDDDELCSVSNKFSEVYDSVDEIEHQSETLTYLKNKFKNVAI